MIDLRLTFTDQEITEYFERSGYATGTRTMGRWRSVSHGDDKWVEYDTLVVYMPDGSCVEAREFLRDLILWKFRGMILTDHAAVDQYVESNSNPCLKKIT